MKVIFGRDHFSSRACPVLRSFLFYANVDSIPNVEKESEEELCRSIGSDLRSIW